MTKARASVTDAAPHDRHTRRAMLSARAGGREVMHVRAGLGVRAVREPTHLPVLAEAVSDRRRHGWAVGLIEALRVPAVLAVHPSRARDHSTGLHPRPRVCPPTALQPLHIEEVAAEDAILYPNATSRD